MSLERSSVYGNTHMGNKIVDRARDCMSCQTKKIMDRVIWYYQRVDNVNWPP